MNKYYTSNIETHPTLVQTLAIYVYIQNLRESFTAFLIQLQQVDQTMNSDQSTVHAGLHKTW